MNNHKIDIKVLTPVHIGSGEGWKGNYEYLLFQEENLVAILDDDKAYEIIGAENIHYWVSVIEKEEDLLAYLRSRKPNLRPEDVSKIIIPVNGKFPGIKNDIKSFTRSTINRRPYLPGSSLKGSMRTAILSSLIKQAPSFVQRKENIGSFRRGRFQFNDAQINANYFGGRDTRRGLIHDPNKDWLRFLRVADSSNASTGIFRYSVINLNYDVWKEKESTFLEAFPIGTILKGQLQIPVAHINKASRHNAIRESTQRRLSIERLFPIINQHTLNLIENELLFIEDENNPDIFGDFEMQLQEIKATIIACRENECILRLGAGSGWDFITGGWARDENVLPDGDLWYDLRDSLRRKRYNDDVPFPKTKKLLENGIPMGFVKIIKT